MTTTVAVDRSAGWLHPGRRAVGIWLVLVALVIVGMVTLGGLTRLTGSGLSITEWHPVTGVIPPLTEHAWQAEFAKYRHIPQYVRENRWMNLSDFKAIFWWEWAHRLLGRMIGVLFLVPFVWFAWKGAIARAQWPRMVLLFALGGLQGFVGWWMVESGLETRVSVSQYRLAIHLGTAIVLLGAILWTALEYLRDEPAAARGFVTPRVQERTSTPDLGAVLAKGSIAFVVLVYCQMLLGALVAGLHAGLIYNTWPSMDGRAYPEGAFFHAPWWINFFNNPGLAQFDHRLGAYLVGLCALLLGAFGYSAGLKGYARASLNAIVALTLFQIALGIETLVNQVPVSLGALHQLTAALLFCAAIWHAFEMRTLRAPNPVVVPG